MFRTMSPESNTFHGNFKNEPLCNIGVYGSKLSSLRPKAALPNSKYQRMLFHLLEKKGKSCFNSFLEGRRPYSQISKASAYWIC